MTAFDAATTATTPVTVPAGAPGSTPATDVRERARRNRLFAGAPAAAVDDAVGRLDVRRYAPGDFVFSQGQPAGEGHGDLYLALEGQLQVLGALPAQGTAAISAIRPDDFFGELALADAQPRSASVLVVTEALVGRLPGPAVDRLLAEAPSVLRNLSAALAARLRTASDALVAVRLQEERLAIVGKTAAALLHDLRNPLGVILMAAGMVKDGVGQPAQLATKIERAARFINGMADDLLLYAKGGARLTLAPVRLLDVVDDVEQFGLAPLEAAGRIAVRRELHGTGTLSADRHALSRALLNLVKNATEAMSEGGTLTFAASVGDDGTATFVVSDTGPGIPDHLLPTLFQPFATHGKPGGTGLGMAMTKSTIDAHGGRITVGRAEGGGARFAITLPLATVA